VSKYYDMDNDSPIYLFDKFVNPSGAEIVYQLIDSDTGVIMVDGLEIETIDSLSSQVQINVNYTMAKVFRLTVFAYVDGFLDISATSNEIQIIVQDVSSLDLNTKPLFV
jgi:hypothetical protein